MYIALLGCILYNVPRQNVRMNIGHDISSEKSKV